MATHSSVLVWRIPGKGEPGELPSTGSHRVGRDGSDLAAAAAAAYCESYTNTILHISLSIGEGNGTPLQYSCLEKSHGQRSLVGCSPWGL